MRIPSTSSQSRSSSRSYYSIPNSRSNYRNGLAFANVTNHFNYNMAATATATHHQYTAGSSSTSSSSSSHREYYCQFCQRRFNKSYNLMIHERSHFEDSFSCDVCGKTGFRSRDLMRQHRSQHSPGGSSSSSTSSSSSCY
ncbi:Protein odd-skipped [Orchesella cincta]|uniref:Protein odd-skipped n=1 Tax=Orchesella cincta TaxID=48709 RepID=A0A1D2NHJ3_ORCCI|nr:Protein odd-skipped [Orchesella cincta]